MLHEMRRRMLLVGYSHRAHMSNLQGVREQQCPGTSRPSLNLSHNARVPASLLLLHPRSFSNRLDHHPAFPTTLKSKNNHGLLFLSLYPSNPNSWWLCYAGNISYFQSRKNINSNKLLWKQKEIHKNKHLSLLLRSCSISYLAWFNFTERYFGTYNDVSC